MLYSVVRLQNAIRGAIHAGPPAGYLRGQLAEVIPPHTRIRVFTLQCSVER